MDRGKSVYVARIVKQVFQFTKSLLFNYECILCRESSDKSLCQHCEDSLSSESIVYKRRSIIINEQGVNIYSFNHYHDHTRKLLSMFKYKKNHLAGEALCCYFATAFKRQNTLEDIDMILPVPSHRLRYLVRGFNQADILANSIAHNSNSTLFLNTISKYKYTKAQAQSDFTTRQNQQMNTFRQRSPLKANHLLIVDDVITTGATIKAIISMLQADGNNQINKISVLTLCRV